MIKDNRIRCKAFKTIQQLNQLGRSNRASDKCLGINVRPLEAKDIKSWEMEISILCIGADTFTFLCVCGCIHYPCKEIIYYMWNIFSASFKFKDSEVGGNVREDLTPLIMFFNSIVVIKVFRKLIGSACRLSDCFLASFWFGFFV